MNDPPATFEYPGQFPKYLALVGKELLFADLGDLAAAHKENMGFVRIFGWMLDEKYNLHQAHPDAPEKELPQAPEKPHTGRPLRFALVFGKGPEAKTIFCTKGESAPSLDQGMTRVEIGTLVLDEHFHVWALANRHHNMLIDAADEYGGNK